MPKSSGLTISVQVKARASPVVTAVPSSQVLLPNLPDGTLSFVRKTSIESTKEKIEEETFSADTMTRPHHHKTMSALLRFAMEKKSDENISFLNAVQDLEEKLQEDLKTSHETREEIQKRIEYQQKLKAIYDLYIVVNASKQVNISKEARHLIEQGNSQTSAVLPFKMAFTIESFKAAYLEIKVLVDSGVIKYFKENMDKYIVKEPETEQPQVGLHIAAMQDPKQIIIALLNTLKPYLLKIDNYQNDHACCCWSFKRAKLDKPKIYKNMSELIVFLEPLSKNWLEALREQTQTAISKSLKCHQDLVGQEEQEIIASMQLAFAAFNTENHKVKKSL